MVHDFYHPVTAHVRSDESMIGKLHNCTHSLTFTAPFSVGHGSGSSLALDQWDSELQWVWVGLGDRTLHHTPGAHQHSSKPWDGAWKLILVSLCCFFCPQMPHRCSLLLPVLRLQTCIQYMPLTKREEGMENTEKKYLLMEINTF